MKILFITGSLVTALLAVMAGCVEHPIPPSANLGELNAIRQKQTVTATPTPAKVAGKYFSSPQSDFSIVEGVRAGAIQLGGTTGEIKSLFDEVPEEWNFEDKAYLPFHSLHWNDEALGNRGVFVFLRKDRAVQIQVFTPRFHLTNGIKSGDDPSRIREHYTGIEAYKLLYSAGEIDGGKDRVYWVVKDKGIAFGLYYAPEKQKRVAKEITIFPPNTEFFPETHISPPQEWERIDIVDSLK
ncbi:MAG: hypothetical protein LC113_13040 [Acidobacteria bacterium]|nr:hypothetical protein [Acidobacteriota bacterium]